MAAVSMRSPSTPASTVAASNIPENGLRSWSRRIVRSQRARTASIALTP